MVHDETFGGGACIHYLDCDDISWVYTYVEIYQILYFRKTYHKRKYWVLYHIISLLLW